MGLLKIINQWYDLRIKRRQLKQLDRQASQADKPDIKLVSDIDTIRHLDPRVKELILKAREQQTHRKDNDNKDHGVGIPFDLPSLIMLAVLGIAACWIDPDKRQLLIPILGILIIILLLVWYLS